MNLKILDNFLEKKDLDDISSIQLEKINKNEIRVYHNSIDKNNNTKGDCINSEILKRLHKNYHDKALSLLKELNPLKVKLYDYSEFHIIETGADYQFPIHDDTPNKLLSGVIYIRPEKNSGTIFYESKKGDGKKIIDWEINRAVFFSRIERETWHSYKGDGKSNRIALVYNLMTNRIKEVYNIEKKNYLLGQLRYKLNPYIYRFFKFTI
tara:strand:+ start:369 stop:995 length:627 start_codon:yes stop_codon:yes gene_type:complete